MRKCTAGYACRCRTMVLMPLLVSEMLDSAERERKVPGREKLTAL